MGRVADQLVNQRKPISIEEYRIRNGTYAIPYIKCRFLGFNSMRSAPIQQHGWNGPAKERIIEGNYLCPKGQITHRYSLEILQDGYCEIPYTQYNLNKLLPQLNGGTVKRIISKSVRQINGELAYETSEVEQTVKPAFELLEQIDFDKPAPINDMGVMAAPINDEYCPKEEVEVIRRKPGPKPKEKPVEV